MISKELSLEDEELTPSMKVRVRNVLERSGDYLGPCTPRANTAIAASCAR